MPIPINRQSHRILALDLGGQLGYAWLPADGHPVYGTWDLTQGAGGRRSYVPAYNLKRLLETEVPKNGFNHIAFEETFAQGEAKLRLDSLQTIVAVYCIEHGLDWSRVAASSLKKFATGDGRCGKEQMVNAARDFFSIRHKPMTYDEADALCVLAWALGY